MKSFLESVFVVEAALLVCGFLFIDQKLAEYDQQQAVAQTPAIDNYGYAYPSVEATTEQPASIRPTGRLILAFLAGVIVLAKIGVLYYLDRPFHTLTDFLKRFSTS